RTGQLLKHLGIGHRPFVVVNDHTERDSVERVIDAAQRGERVALVSDAGMPAISDPGYVLVRAAIVAGVDVEVIPGPSAVLSALVLSGLATDRFAFDGFLPRKGGERNRRLAEVAVERRTVVLYEAPHRVERTLVDLAGVCGGERQIALARELTKLYEEVWRGSIAEALEHVAVREPRGEYVIVVDGAPEVAVGADDIETALRAAIEAGASKKDAAAEVSKRLGLRKRDLYDRALSLDVESGAPAAR
ncbi:MAG: 16S rRNA (cytidine(1402)-2'-O)-methyltransferase, partial [Actinobacteria bacterium]|nr:16S rRNA (cytidine(1402)-2'-O)-methyltransferase [Actinomycetota bacterium]